MLDCLAGANRDLEGNTLGKKRCGLHVSASFYGSQLNGSIRDYGAYGGRRMNSYRHEDM